LKHIWWESGFRGHKKEAARMCAASTLRSRTERRTEDVYAPDNPE
jgi:hypothetical protein